MFNVGDKAVVVNTENHHLPLGCIVIIISNNEVDHFLVKGQNSKGIIIPQRIRKHQLAKLTKLEKVIF